MRKIIESKTQINEVIQEEVAGRNMVADRLIEKWSKKRGLGLDKGGFEKIYEASPRKARNLATILENQERHLTSLTETQISSVFNSTPQTIVKVIRLGYPNSVRGEIFTDWAMQTVKDSFYKVETTYDRTNRGATAGKITYENTSDRYASEVMEEVVPPAAATHFGGTLSVAPLRPFTVQLMVNDQIVATDNGSNLFVGAALSTSVASTIDYITGVFDVTFASALHLSDDVLIRYFYNSEVEALYNEQGQVNLNLVAYDFRAKPWHLGFSWSKMTELYMDSALSMDAEEALISAGADELKKSLDFQALKMAYRGSKWATAEIFNTDWAAAGADSDYAHTQSVTKALRNASGKTYAALMRGGDATSYVCGQKAVTYLTNHKLFTPNTSPVAVGAYLAGNLGGVPVYQAPSDVVPTDEIMCVYKNNREESNDSALVCATLVPMYRTDTLEYKNLYKETGLAHFGDLRLMTHQYLTRVKLTSLV